MSHTPQEGRVQTIKESGADVIVETTNTNLETGMPGLSHVREALSLGKHVITSNKGPPALAYNELKAIGDKNNALRWISCLC